MLRRWDFWNRIKELQYSSDEIDEQIADATREHQLGNVAKWEALQAEVLAHGEKWKALGRDLEDIRINFFGADRRAKPEPDKEIILGKREDN